MTALPAATTRRRARRPSLALRALVFLRAPALDYKLAGEPDVTPQLALRAEQLGKQRETLAGRFEEIVERSFVALPHISTAVAENRAAVASARRELLELAA